MVTPLTGLILRGTRGKPLHLDNLSRRVIKRALDEAGIDWHGFRPNRTGVSTITPALTRELAAKRAATSHDVGDNRPEQTLEPGAVN